MGKLPDRWLDYQPMGKQIAGTKFICFKVPLREGMCQDLQGDQRFTPEMVRQRCPNVKLVVDLTNTTRYYNGHMEFTDLGVKYKKIQTPGHVIPPSNFVTEFFSAVDSFLNSSPDDESLIGVHCTHGLNRTSYFICSYMINRMGFDPQEAMRAFEEARGHKIERQNYIDDLLKGGQGSATSRLERRREERAIERPRCRDSRPTPMDRSQRREPRVTPAEQPRQRSRCDESSDWRHDAIRHQQQHSYNQPPSRQSHRRGGSRWDAGFERTDQYEPAFPGQYYQDPLDRNQAPGPAMTYAEHRARKNMGQSVGVGDQGRSWRSMKAPNSSSSSDSIARPNNYTPNPMYSHAPWHKK